MMKVYVVFKYDDPFSGKHSLRYIFSNEKDAEEYINNKKYSDDYFIYETEVR